jgi:hypothetical protein
MYAGAGTGIKQPPLRDFEDAAGGNGLVDYEWLKRAFGAFMLAAGLFFLLISALYLVEGRSDWSYFSVGSVGPIFVGLRRLLNWDRPKKRKGLQ